MPNINLVIDGKSVSVPEGTTVFQAASTAGVFVPHYCYHPDLSVAGVCRMCMVEIEKTARAQISCNTLATEGMVVRTDTPKIKEVVRGVLELHLINHPLDCPICDKAGECGLQDFYQQYGLYESRMEFEKKVHKPKVQDIGTIMLDAERCILCTRCVRFTAEVTKTHELGIFNRGDRSELATYDSGPLRNDYTGNLADICPVGALTAKDFRFQCRVWFLEKTATVCGLCAQGCNTTVSVNPQTKKLYRVEPRRNPEVNRSWICDRGRWGFHRLHENRIGHPIHKGAESTWSEAFSAIRKRLDADTKHTLALLSTQLTNEEIVDCFQVLKELGVESFGRLVDESATQETEPFDGILQYRDRTANSKGFRRVASTLGIVPVDPESDKVGHYQTILAIGLEGDDLVGWERVARHLPEGAQVVIHAANHHGSFEIAEWIVPNVTVYEKSGTVINAKHRLQRVCATLPKQMLSRNAHDLMWGLLHGSDLTAPPALRVRELFDQTIAPMLPSPVRLEVFPPMGVSLE